MEKDYKMLRELMTSKAKEIIDWKIEREKEKVRKDLIEEDIKRLEGKKKEMTWLNCQKHNLLTSIKELKECKDCEWEIDEIEAREYNQAIQEEINYKKNNKNV
jgi:hypothetical protein